MKQRSPDRSASSALDPSQRPWKQGSRSPASVGQDEHRQPQGRGRARQRGEWGTAVTQPPQLPREHFTTSPILRACLTEHPKQFQDYISLSHLFARGVTQALELGGPGAPRSSLHTHRHTLAKTHIQVHLQTHRNTQACTCREHTNSGSVNQSCHVAQPQGTAFLSLLLSYTVIRAQQGT